MAVTITATPQRALLDETIRIQISNLHPISHVTLVCRVQESGIQYFSYGYYTSDDNGSVDTESMSAQPGGSYDGVEPMGFIWSLSAEPGQPPGRRLVKHDVTTPIFTHLYVLGNTVPSGECLESVARRQWLAYTSCDRIHLGDGVERIEVRDGGLLGTLFIPAGPGPFPGILDLFGTIGNVVEHRSALLASRGIAAFALCYFTMKTHGAVKTDVEYFEKAIDYMLKHPKVRKPYAGVVGISLGANISLLIGSVCPKIRACIEINGTHLSSMMENTYQGRVFPALPLDFTQTYNNTADGLVFRDVFYSITEEEHEKYAIPVEEGSCEFLLIHGEDDQSVLPVATEYIPRRLKRFGKNNCRVLVYPGAGHLIEPPHSPHFHSTFHALIATLTIWGGEPKLHARAQEDSWKRIINFFKSTLGEQRTIEAGHKEINSHL